MKNPKIQCQIHDIVALLCFHNHMSKIVTAAMMVIGNEILSGRTQDANIQHLAEELGNKGIQLKEVRIVPDIEDMIVEATQQLSSRYNYLFTTGGIGPTHDDITSDCIAKAFGVENVIHPVAFKLMADFYASKDIDFNTARQRMAHTPEGAELVENHVSLAPGYRMKNVFVLAGVPRIMRNMLAGILPSLENGSVIKSHAISTDLPEGVLAEHLSSLQAEFPQVDIGSYPKDRKGKVGYDVTLILRSSDYDGLKSSAQKLQTTLVSLGGLAVEGETL